MGLIRGSAGLLPGPGVMLVPRLTRLFMANRAAVPHQPASPPRSVTTSRMAEFFRTVTGALKRARHLLIFTALLPTLS